MLNEVPVILENGISQMDEVLRLEKGIDVQLWYDICVVEKLYYSSKKGFVVNLEHFLGSEMSVETVNPKRYWVLSFMQKLRMVDCCDLLLSLSEAWG